MPKKVYLNIYYFLIIRGINQIIFESILHNRTPVGKAVVTILQRYQILVVWLGVCVCLCLCVCAHYAPVERQSVCVVSWCLFLHHLTARHPFPSPSPCQPPPICYQITWGTQWFLCGKGESEVHHLFQAPALSQLKP